MDRGCGLSAVRLFGGDADAFCAECRADDSGGLGTDECKELFGGRARGA